MAASTDFFVATPTEIGELLAGWKLPPSPLATPREYETVNPFTRKVQVIRSRLLALSSMRMSQSRIDATSIPVVSMWGLLFLAQLGSR